VPIEYQGETFSEGFRADLIVGDLVIVELKSIERVTPAHKKQLLTYLRLTGLKLGYLLNFGEALMRDGITRTINGQLFTKPSCLCASVREKIIPTRICVR
jgi:GxxExxY protein